LTASCALLATAWEKGAGIFGVRRVGNKEPRNTQ
jgi:hypothetical protein